MLNGLQATKKTLKGLFIDNLAEAVSRVSPTPHTATLVLDPVEPLPFHGFRG
jgi:hypothetical protein